MIISREVDINVNRYGLRVVIPVVQYDSGRQIIFNIIDAELPSGCTSNIFIRKPSGKSVYNSCTVSGNKVTVTLTNQSLSECGLNDAQIQVIKGEEVVTSFGFILEVKQSNADNAVISKTESTFFQGIVNKAQAAATTAERVLDSIPDDYSQMSTKVNANTTAITSINSNFASLTGGIVVPNGADLNDYKTPGNYYSYNNITIANSPVPSSARGFVMKVESSAGQLDSTYVRQTFRFYNDNNIYVRYSYSKGFTAWELMPTRAEIDANTTAIATLNNRTKTYDYTLSSGNFLDWVRTTFTSNGEYYVIYATNNYDGWAKSSIGSCLVQRRNNDYFLTAYINETNVADQQAIYVNRYVANAWTGWSKLPTRSEVNTNTNAIATNKTAITANTDAITTLNNNLGGYKLVGYTASVVLNKAGEFIIPYPSGENFGTVYGILSATFLQGGYCLPNPPLSPSSTSPAYDIQAAVAFRLLSSGIAIYTGGAWGADSRDIYFVLICKT